MTAIPTQRPTTSAQASHALYAAIDAAASVGRRTPCRLTSAYDADGLDAIQAADLVTRCLTGCPVLQQCSDVAALLPVDAKAGSVIAGVYHPATRTAVWQGLYDDLRDRIEAGEYEAGDRLPSMDELTRTTGMHGNTIRTALDHLERDGIAVADGEGSRLVVGYGAALSDAKVDGAVTDAAHRAGASRKAA